MILVGIYLFAPGEEPVADEPSRPPERTVTQPEPRIAWSDERLAIVDKPAGLLVHPAPGNPGPSLVEALGELLGRRTRPGAARDRPPARPGHLRPARRRPRRRRRMRPSGALIAAARGLPRVRGPGRGPAAVADRDDRRAARPRPPRARARRRRRTPAAPGGRPTSRSARRCPATPLLDAPARDRPHPPDPRPPAGDRPSGCRRPAVRRRRCRYGLDRQFLHSRRLAFEHPFTGEQLEFESAAAGRPRGRAGAAPGVPSGRRSPRLPALIHSGPRR